MKADDDWTRWGDTWRSQPPIDADRLRRLVAQKRRRMLVMVAFRLVGTALAMALCVQMLLRSSIPWIGRAWFLFLLALAPVMLYVRLREYRGTWREADESVPSMLGVTIKRARAGIRLARISQVGTCCAAAVLPALFWVTSTPSMPPHALVAQAHDLVDPFLIATAANTLVQLVLFVYASRYARGEGRRLCEAEAMLAESTGNPDDKPYN